MPTYISLGDATLANREEAYRKCAEFFQHAHTWDLTLTSIVRNPATQKVEVTVVQTLNAAQRAHVGLA